MHVVVISKLVETKLQRERKKLQKNPQEVKKENGNRRNIEKVEHIPQNKIVEINPNILVAKLSAIALSFPIKRRILSD